MVKAFGGAPRLWRVLFFVRFDGRDGSTSFGLASARFLSFGLGGVASFGVLRRVVTERGEATLAILCSSKVERVVSEADDAIVPTTVSMPRQRVMLPLQAAAVC